MSIATCEADGVQPSGVELRVRRQLARLSSTETVAAVQLAAAAVAALGLAITPAAEVKPPASPVPAAITVEALAGPPPGAAVAERVDTRRMLQDLLTKAGLRPDFGLRHLTWDQARRLNAAMPQAHAPLDAARPFILAIDTKNGREALHCLTQAAYYEAGGNGPDAEAAVVQVVLNRVRHPDFPKSVCGVVYQGAERETGCQFTFTCDGALSRPIDKAAWERARKVAARALTGYVVPSVGASTYYHADYVFPTWAPTLQKTATVGPHIFYRMTGSEGAASALTGHYAGGELKLARTMLRALAPKRAHEDEPALVQAKAQVPAGLKVQADRLKRVHDLVAASVKSEETRIETASVQPPTAAVPAETPVAAAPVAATADASVPAA